MLLHTGRPSIAPEKLLRALLLQVLYTVRSERQLMEQLDYNLLFRWFVGLGIDDSVWERSVFSANRERLFSEALSRELFERVLAIAEWQNLVSDEHFSVDGSLIEAWASHKSFVIYALWVKRMVVVPINPPAAIPRSTSAAKSVVTPPTKARDPEIYSSKKGNQWFFGRKFHIGVDSETGLVHTLKMTSGHVSDVAEAVALVHGEEQFVHGDAGGQTARDAQR